MSDSQFQFPELFQFFGGYFYQGWSADYNWESQQLHFAAVVRHFKSLNPPSTVNRVISEIEQLLLINASEKELDETLAALGNNYYLTAKEGDHRQWLTAILSILRESAVNDRILRELN